jgi:hypothetical protein
MRRDLKSILSQFDMDPDRREVYVEGHDDAVFLRWLNRNRCHVDVRILEISNVDLPNTTEGGERGRAIEFAKQIGDKDINIIIFVDADYDRVFKRSMPQKVYFTDRRDLEGYFLLEECFDNVFKMGLKKENISAINILNRVALLSREIGFIRLLSEINDYKLPFQETDLWPYLVNEDNSLTVKIDSLLQTLFQNAERSLSEIPIFRKKYDEIKVQYKEVIDYDLIHGKDAICIFDKIVVSMGNYGGIKKKVGNKKPRKEMRKIKRNEGERLLWASFKEEYIAQFDNLNKVCNFIKGN